MEKLVLETKEIITLAFGCRLETGTSGGEMKSRRATLLLFYNDEK